MTPQDAFIARLRRSRQRSRISLEEIAIRTRIKLELLDALERHDLTEWPRGLYARAWVRAYASAVGLDPADTVEEFCRLFPHGDRRTGGMLQAMAAIVAHPSEYRDEFTSGADRRRAADRRHRTPHINMLPRPAWHATLIRRAYALWMRIATQRPAPVRLKRTPRPSA